MLGTPEGRQSENRNSNINKGRKQAEDSNRSINKRKRQADDSNTNINKSGKQDGRQRRRYM